MLSEGKPPKFPKKKTWVSLLADAQNKPFQLNPDLTFEHEIAECRSWWLKADRTVLTWDFLKFCGKNKIDPSLDNFADWLIQKIFEG